MPGHENTCRTLPLRQSRGEVFECNNKSRLMLSLSKHDRAIDLRNQMCSENTHARI